MKSNWKIRDQFLTLFLLAFVKWIELLEIESTNTQAHSKHPSSCRSWADHVHDHERVHHHRHHGADDDDEVWVHFNSQNWGNLSAKKYEFCRLFENNNNHNKKRVSFKRCTRCCGSPLKIVRSWPWLWRGIGLKALFKLPITLVVLVEVRRCEFVKRVSSVIYSLIAEIVE